MDSLKTSAGRMREACVAKIHEMRGAFDAEGKPCKPARTYRSIATELNLSLGTVYNVCKGRTHKDDHPMISAPASEVT